jgi:tetratricopeptide (TPR) repeat protein
MAAGSWALPVVTPPPVIVIPPAPLVPDPLARFVKASGWVPGPRGPVRAELILDGADAVIRVSSADAPRPRIYTISSPSEVLVLLADKHMEFLWKPLAEWAGPGLETFREQRLAKLRAAAALGNTPYNATTATESTVRPKYRAQLQLAAFLTAIGRSGESDQLLQSQLAEIKLKQNAGWSGIEWFSIAARIANNRWARGDNAGAIAEYAWMEQSMGDSPYAVNATVNRAAFLAMSGQYAAALPAIEAAYARYLKDNRGDRIAGSERQFAWIRACALDGLGRHSEAMEQFRVVMDDRQWRDPDFVIESNSNVRVRGWTCMKQTDALIAYLKDAAREDLFAGALMPLQPARKLNHDRELWAKVRADPELAKLVNERMRVLPAEYDAALNAWGTGEQ